MPPPAAPPTASWWRDALRRTGILWLPKMLGIALGMAGFFLVYFHLLENPRRAPAVMPRLGLDDLIGLQPAALPLYLSLWVYVSLAVALLPDARAAVRHALAALALAAAGLACFWRWPTTLPPAGVDWTLHPSLAFLKSADAAGNACPSLHVAFAVFSGAALHRALRELHAGRTALVVNGLWCAGIVYSTIATLQHVTIDALAGAALGAGAALFEKRLFNVGR